MINDYQTTLRKYWGYSSFRPLQEEIILSVLAGKDTLALMPTGGGKSLTFQVPAMTLPGLCLVVTPLISLMKDQVENLKKLQIRATAIHSGCTRDEIDIAFNNCLYGGYKFLYVSPERLSSELFRVRFQEMQVNLITVDEAHCISQWGYDFRPSYMKIAELRQIHPDVPVLAVTATATSEVIDDIQQKLKFRAKNLLKTSFRRENLIYAVKYSENKDRDVIEMVRKLKGSGIVYVRSRRKSIEISRILTQEGISAAYYNAGLEHQIRTTVQQNWTIGKVRVIVATNAFGMGIDKADVRFVIHADLPDSPEAYFQEAGRAGRDGTKSFAILLSSPSDVTSVNQRILINFPDITTIKNTYSALCNYLQIPIGGGKGMTFDFDINDFARTFRFSVFTSFSSLKILELEGYIELTEEINNPSRIKFILSRDDLYKFQVSNSKFDSFIKLLLRSYTGVFTEYTAIDETLLAKRANVDQSIVRQYLSKLVSLGVISYLPQKRSPMVIFFEERLDEKSIYISKENYQTRKIRYTERANSILLYSLSSEKCRSQALLEYFGEKNSPPCGECDICRSKKDEPLTNDEFRLIRDEILKNLIAEPYELEKLLEGTTWQRYKLISVLQWLLDNNYIRFNQEQLLELTHDGHLPAGSKSLG
ncbi:MAG TPA: ATP-dependent DNA helicase RecQ [Bacteroidales bacterium]|nr:ATP-dependent DNA helicase RecQ [Bacteroidales bacterium]